MLNQKIEEKWKWILIPMFIIFEVVIDDYVLQRIYRLFFNPTDHFLLYINVYKIVSIIVICLLNYWIIQQKVFFKPGERKRWWLSFLIVCLIIVAFCIPSQNFWSALDIGLLAGLSEELMFRGIILGFLLKLMTNKSDSRWRVMLCLTISSLLFGGLHYVNLSMQSFSGTTYQVINAVAFGMILGALYIKSGTIIVPMALHFISDFLFGIIGGLPKNNYTPVQNSQWIGLVVYVLIYLVIALTIVNYKASNNKILPKLKNL
ncbi:MAG: lysostaphin resistance A-like protein [Apilactobacillus waqarii]|uniref:CPBP family intramembrane glutamic endopeptidase n=1 Tax=Apilactobacillus waqarii TaxID=2851006 RepID=UPI003F32544C